MSEANTLNVQLPLATSPTLSPDSPRAPPSTPNESNHPNNRANDLMNTPTRARVGSAPLAPATVQAARNQSINLSVNHHPSLPSQQEMDEEEKEPSSGSDASLMHIASPFSSFSARIQAARRKSPIPKLEIKINQDDDSIVRPTQPVNQSNNHGKIEDLTSNRSLTSQSIPAVPETPFISATPQNSPLPPQTPNGRESNDQSNFFPAHPLDVNALAQAVTSLMVQALNQSNNQSRKRGTSWTNLPNYQPITPTHTPHTPSSSSTYSWSNQALNRSQSFAQVPLTPAPLTPNGMGDNEPPPTPNSARPGQSPPRLSPRAGASQLNQSINQAISQLPPNRHLTRSVSHGIPAASRSMNQSNSQPNWREDSTPNTPMWAQNDPMTPINTPNPLFQQRGPFTVGLQSMNPSNNQSLNQVINQLNPNRQFVPLHGVPNTPCPPSEPNTPLNVPWGPSIQSNNQFSRSNGHSNNQSNNSSTNGSNNGSNNQSPSKSPAGSPHFAPILEMPYQSLNNPTLNHNHVTSPLTHPSIAPAVSYLLLAITQSTTQSTLSLTEKCALTDEILATSPVFLAIMTQLIERSNAPLDYDSLAGVINMLRGTAVNQPAIQPSVQQTINPASPLGLTVQQSQTLQTTIGQLGLNRIGFGTLFDAFESESQFDELTVDAFNRCLGRLLDNVSVNVPAQQLAQALQTVYQMISSNHSNNQHYVSWSAYVTTLTVLCAGSVNQKISAIYQIFDTESNNAIGIQAVNHFVNNFVLVVDLLSGANNHSNNQSVEHRARALIPSDLTGKICMKKFLSWATNPVKLLTQECKGMYQE